MSDSSSNLLPAALTAATATTALALTLTLPLLQMDVISRKILDPRRLRIKRRKQQ